MSGYPVDEAGFERLVDANKRRIMWIARTYAPADSLNDLYQEILLEIWKGLPRYQGRAKIETWIWRVALNTAITFRRKANRQRSGFEVREELARYQSVSQTVRSPAAILDEFIRSLEDVDRSLLLMCLDGEFGYPEMAEVTGLKEANVRVRISRIKKAYAERYL